MSSLGAQNFDNTFAVEVFGSVENPIIQEFTTNMVAELNDLKNHKKSYANTFEFYKARGIKQPKYDNIASYVKATGDRFGATIFNDLESANSIGNFRESLHDLALRSKLSNDQKYVLVCLDYFMQLAQNNSLKYVSKPGGNSVIRVDLVIDWRCIGAIGAGAILGGLEGAAAGSSVPGLGTAAGGIIGAIAGGIGGAVAGCK